MPTYEYQCQECGIAFERFQHFSDQPLRICPECNGPVRRVIHPVGVIFKGSGFYVTDNRGNNPASPPTEAKEKDKAIDKGKEPAKPESASETKPEKTVKSDKEKSA
jgi:putative FmdB family regulatory protein